MSPKRSACFAYEDLETRYYAPSHTISGGLDLISVNTLHKLLGTEPDNTSRIEKLVSTLGGIVSIFLIAEISYRVTGASGASLIVPSMGASAVLLFAVPHGKLSQPWALFGGHGISAVIGVLCYQLVPDTFLAAGLAVGLAIGAMHLANCIHPPGGATALAAVIGGPAIHSLGYSYLLSPIMLNCLVIFSVAVFFNGFFPWRRYPSSLMVFAKSPGIESRNTQARLDRKHIEQAMEDMDLIVDVTTDDLQRLFALTREYAEQDCIDCDSIELGHYYTNGKHGSRWSVRKIIDEHRSSDPQHDMVVYRVVEGHDLRSSSSCTREEFSQWASHEVFPMRDKKLPGE